MTKHLSQKQKITMCNYCNQRDGHICLYCQKPVGLKCVLDHLNNDRTDNRLENLVRVHQCCNITKAYNTDYEIIARTKLEENELSLFVPVEDNTSDQVSTETKINVANSGILLQYLDEVSAVNDMVFKDDLLYSSVFKMRKMTGHGSIQCAREYLKIYTSSLAPYMEAIDPKTKRKIIVKRIGN